MSYTVPEGSVRELAMVVVVAVAVCDELVQELRGRQTLRHAGRFTRTIGITVSRLMGTVIFTVAAVVLHRLL